MAELVDRRRAATSRGSSGRAAMLISFISFFNEPVWLAKRGEQWAALQPTRHSRRRAWPDNYEAARGACLAGSEPLSRGLRRRAPAAVGPSLGPDRQRPFPPPGRARRVRIVHRDIADDAAHARRCAGSDEDLHRRARATSRLESRVPTSGPTFWLPYVACSPEIHGRRGWPCRRGSTRSARTPR